MAAIVAFVEWPLKTWIFKKNDKYKLVYTYAPVVLSIVVYLVMALVQKTDILPGVIHGVGIGLAAMGSYDAILKIIKNKGSSGLKELGEEIKKEVESK